MKRHIEYVPSKHLFDLRFVFPRYTQTHTHYYKQLHTTEKNIKLGLKQVKEGELDNRLR